MVQAFTDFAAWLLGIFQQFFDAGLVFLERMVLTILDMLKDVAIWLFEQILTLTTTIIGVIDMSGLSAYSPSGLIAQLPSDVSNIMGLIGMGTCMNIIAAAILIRLSLQLIPFTRLGS